MDVLSTSRLIQREHENVSAQFVQLELDLAITFCETALVSEGERSQRNFRNARIAYSSARKFLRQIGHRGKAYRMALDEKFERLTLLFDEVERKQPAQE